VSQLSVPHPNDWRIEYWGSVKPQKSWARATSIRQSDEEKHASYREKYGAE